MSRDLERRLADAPRPPRANLDAIRERLARRAADEGILDVAYAPLDSPLGELTVFVTPRGLVRLSYPGAQRISPRILAAPERTDAVRRELEAYFGGRLHRFETPVDWRLVGGFSGEVLRATARVPFGSLTTYRDVARAAGSPRAFRAAGNALHVNPIPIVVPCHRVVPSSGRLGGYGGGVERKEFLLRLEGATLPFRNPAVAPRV
jgi:methylated-DNA-[protein]-cysteine S-methyltransferase